MGAPEIVALTLQVPLHQVGSLKELLRQHPQLSYFRRGWIVATIAIVGPPQAMNSFRPQLEKWQHDCASADAW
jgi:hypothetical protein